MKKTQIIKNCKEAQLECFELMLHNAISDQPSEAMANEMLFTHFMIGLDLYLLTSLN